MPPDAVAWIVSDFQRESLEPSSTYQTSVTTVAPNLLAHSTKSPSSDNYTYRSDGKRPIKNIITTSLTKQLQIVRNISANGHTDKPINRTILSNETELNDDSDVRTAPSYTFYAPQKILQRSKFVLDMSRDVLEYLQDWLNVKYPLAKLGKPTVLIFENCLSLTCFAFPSFASI